MVQQHKPIKNLAKFVVLIVLTCLCISGNADAIHKAAEKGDIAKVKALLAANPGLISVAESGSFGNLPLHSATEFGREAIVGLLLAKRADVNCKNQIGMTPIFIASATGNVKLVNILYAAGARIGLTNNDGDSPLHIASFRGNALVVKELLAFGSKVNVKNHNGDTPLALCRRPRLRECSQDTCGKRRGHKCEE